MNTQIRILVVDDEMSVLDSLDDIFEQRGYRVSLAEDGYKAIEMAKKEHFDIVLTDVKMPGINGVETFREIKRYSPSTIVIMMTGYSVEELLKQAMEMGAHAVIYKPFDVEKLIKTIEGAMQNPLIMVVDDRDEDRETIKDILSEKGYRVITAGDGYQALDLIVKANFDIIIMDFKMPRMDGLRTLEWIKEIKPHVGIIMMSAFPMDEIVGQAIREGALAFLYKPVEMEKLLKIIDEFTREKLKATP